MKLHTVLFAGLGGTGSLGFTAAAKLLMYHPQGTWRIILADFDKFEPGNATRQIFRPNQVGVNKAQAVADQHPEMPNLIVEPVRIDYDTLPRIIKTYHPDSSQMFVVVCLVDNHASRHAILKVCDEHLPNYVYISPGNKEFEFQASIHVRRQGKGLTPHPFTLYHDIATPQDGLPGDCAEVAAVSSPQTVTANAMAASTMLLYLNALLEDLPLKPQIFGDIRTFEYCCEGKEVQIKV